MWLHFKKHKQNKNNNNKKNTINMIPSFFVAFFHYQWNWSFSKIYVTEMFFVHN